MSGHRHPSHYPMDVPLKAAIGRLTHGISPSTLSLSFQDWAIHLAASPGKQVELLQSVQMKFLQWLMFLQEAAMGNEKQAPQVPAQDKRFAQPQWRKPPFNALAQAFQLTQQWWEEAMTGVRGVSDHHEEVASFMVRQWLDMASPSNGVFTNPQVLEATLSSFGMNLWRGAANGWRDAMRVATNSPPPGVEQYRPGEVVAITPGQVVFRNHLIELIQYAPTTPVVHPEPVLMVPSWIMKYYILDLSPHNSMVRHLVGQGHTVFMVSWRNPGAELSQLGMDDYLEQGVLAALHAVQRAQPGRQVHLAGYCLGGTMAAIAAALLANQKPSPFRTLTLLAGQTDFQEPGELGLFIDQSQIDFLEDIMAERGYLDGRQMAGAFALINSKDLVWSKLVHEYLMGGTQHLDDMHAWNADATRMPARMHAEYLHRLYLQNDLGEGRYNVRGRPAVLDDIRLPMFVVGTERDHVSPWRSVYKIHLLTHTEILFVLTTGGHNVGIVNPPMDAAGSDNPEKAARISHRWAVEPADAPHKDADTWMQAANRRQGSWWPTWHDWLVAHSGKPVEPLPIGGTGPDRLPPLGPAPGTYVHEF